MKRPRVPEPFRGSLVGRDADLASIEALVRSGARLVTLLGPGGVGKTRLLHRALQALAPRFERAAFCDLSSARSAGDVVTGVANAVSGVALGAAASDEEGAARVGRALARRGAFLLGADNLEQIEDATLPLFTQWLGSAPRLVILATSRVRLGAPGEVVHPVAPLPPSFALELFIGRANAARGTSSFTEEETVVAEKIVRILEGMPLALEMAATRLRVLAPQELLERLSRPLAVLASGTRGDPDRHASLSRVLDGSWDLLDAEAKKALAALGVFVGGFTLDAAEAVLDPKADAVTLLQRFVDSSLVRVVAARSARTRYVPYEVVREYALERLTASTRLAATQLRHATWMADWAESRDVSDAVRAQNALLDEEANLIAAAAFTRGRDEHRTLHLRLLCALEPVRLLRGQLDEWARDLERALATDLDATDPMLVARATLSYARALHERLVDPARARAAYERAVAAARRTSDPTAIAHAIAGKGRLLAGLGEWLEACVLFAEARAFPGAADWVRKRAAAYHEFYGTESGASTDVVKAAADYVEVCRSRGDSRELVFWLVQLGRVESELVRQRAPAEAHLEEALALARSLGDVGGEGYALFGIGAHQMAYGIFDAAEATLTTASTLLRDAGTRRYEGWSIGFLGTTRALAGDLPGALAALDEALVVLEGVADTPRQAHLLAYRGAIKARLGDEAAARADFDRAAALVPERSLYHAWTLDLARAQLDVRADPARAEELLAKAGWPKGGTDEARSWPWGIDFYEPRIAALLLESAIESARAAARGLAVARDGTSFVLPNGANVVVPGRGKLAQIVLVLARARSESPGTPVPAGPLIEAAWPKERIKADAAQNRLHVALDQLRKIGLRGILVRGGGGFRLDPDVPFAWLSDEGN